MGLIFTFLQLIGNHHWEGGYKPQDPISRLLHRAGQRKLGKQSCVSPCGKPGSSILPTNMTNVVIVKEGWLHKRGKHTDVVLTVWFSVNFKLLFFYLIPLYPSLFMCEGFFVCLKSKYRIVFFASCFQTCGLTKLAHNIKYVKTLKYVHCAKIWKSHVNTCWSNIFKPQNKIVHAFTAVWHYSYSSYFGAENFFLDILLYYLNFLERRLTRVCCGTI